MVLSIVTQITGKKMAGVKAGSGDDSSAGRRGDSNENSSGNKVLFTLMTINDNLECLESKTAPIIYGYFFKKLNVWYRRRGSKLCVLFIYDETVDVS
jgi:hypothetical protein